ncbi:MAG: trehalase family glycosidase [Flavobacteriaceae bacterium]
MSHTINYKASSCLILTILLVVLTFESCTTASTQKVKAVRYADYYASDFYHDVQMAHFFPDSKTFADATPHLPLDELLSRYAVEKEQEGFSLKVFVETNFELPKPFQADFVSDRSRTVQEHIVFLWDKLTRSPDSNKENSSLIPLPKKYIVPGGRFREIYYWDSYFTIKGLKLSHPELAEAMVDNFAHLIDTIGFIPNGNRHYYMTRSQPPFFALMVNEISATSPEKAIKYLPALEKEYSYWMQANKTISIDGMTLNRYFDTGTTPRPESHREDYELAQELSTDQAKKTLYSNLRTGAMSGWDYSSRWFADNQNLASIEVIDILPVDLNCLLYGLEKTLSETNYLNGNVAKGEQYAKLAQARKKAIQKLFWNEESQFFEDYHFKHKAHTGRRTLAGGFPLFLAIATQEQAKGVKDNLQRDFLKAGGFVTSLQNTGQQWDAPNGWAPLQWTTIIGLENYGFTKTAQQGSQRWLNISEKVYRTTGKMMEKYNVMDLSLTAGGGEYPNQDGFGWTNGVVLALNKRFSP